ncbi:MAG: hypothetical protein IJT23_03275 [Clostridia bacterium]|nr:hypothetical protein [Clostridia bacterium]
MNKMQNGDYNCVEDFTCLLRGYILKKFLLDENCTADKISDLLDESIKKILILTNEEGFDMSDNPTCTGSSSKIEKKLLMLVKLKKDLGLEIGIDELVFYGTVTELSEKIYELLESMGER